MFRPSSATIPRLQAGIYRVGADTDGPWLERMHVVTDFIIDLPDAVNQRLLCGIQKFWASREKYKKSGLLFKRGAILIGPPGSGKSISVSMLSSDLVMRDGIVLHCPSPGAMVEMLPKLRLIEPDRPLIVVLEDIDELISTFGEHNILSMLDGENQVQNIVFIASTNYPWKLGARIVNRPSRFDERIYVGMPSETSRRVYLDTMVPEAAPAIINQWVADSNGFSIAHLRELVASVHCLEQDYSEVIARLKSMMKKPKDAEDGFTERHDLGFTASGH